MTAQNDPTAEASAAVTICYAIFGKSAQIGASLVGIAVSFSKLSGITAFPGDQCGLAQVSKPVFSDGTNLSIILVLVIAMSTPFPQGMAPSLFR
jgi:hypothetical protein